MTFILEYDKNHTKIQKSYLVKILKNPLKARLSSCQPAVRYDGYSCLNREIAGFAYGFPAAGRPGGVVSTDEKRSERVSGPARPLVPRRIPNP